MADLRVMEILENSQELELSLSHPLVVLLAVKRSKNSKYAIKWALEKFLLEKGVLFKLLHVRAPITKVPTPLGNYPISQVRDDIAAAYKKEVGWKTLRMLLPYKQMFAEKKVEVDALVIEADNVEEAISREVSKLKNSKLVIGASSRGRFKWKLKNQCLSSRISERTPSFCTVYLVNKGKLMSVRQSSSKSEHSTQYESSDANTSSSSLSSYNFSSQIDGTEQASTASDIHSAGHHFKDLSFINQVHRKSTSDFHSASHHFKDLSFIDRVRHKSRSVSFDIMHSRREHLFSNRLDIQSVGSGISGTGSFQMDLHTLNSGQASVTDGMAKSKIDINFELEKLRIELRHAQGMYSIAQNEKFNASEQLNNLSKRRIQESLKLQEICLREEHARESARQEKERHEATKREAEFLGELVEREASEREEAERKAARDAYEYQKFEKVLKGPFEPYKKFTWNEIVSATSSFSDDGRIGMGSYGTVYRCTLNHVTAAVKVLHAKGQRNKEFQQELDILSKTRHPHLLLLLGVCADHSCLVYEYMVNGSLEDRLLQKNRTPPIPWFKRFRIAWEVASALVFLHNTKPRPIVHRDLKPANILLDQNLVSKIGDVGLSTLLPSVENCQSPIHTNSGLVGTLSYIDPEYQRSGLISPQSDVYAFGMIILQLLTAKPALALAYMVETALEKGKIMELLDSTAGSWPVKEATELAIMGLRCTEIRRIDRPDLNAEVLPVLERLKETCTCTLLELHL